MTLDQPALGGIAEDIDDLIYRAGIKWAASENIGLEANAWYRDFDEPETKLFDEDFNLTPPRLRGSGVATRVRDTNRFQFVRDGESEGELIMLMGLTEWNDFRDFPAAVVVSGVHFPRHGVGVACTRPDDRSAALPVADLVDFWLGSGVDFDAKFLTGGVPHLFLEVEAA